MDECYKGLISEVENDIQTAYVLENENSFYDIGFKVMQNQDNMALFRCNRLKYNGKTKLVYFTSEYQSVADLCGQISIERFCLLVGKIINAIDQVDGLGFLNMAFVDSRVTHIFTDRTEQEVKFIYLPISDPKIRKNRQVFDNEIKSQLIRLIETRYQMSDAKTGLILQTLKDATLTMQQIGRIVAQIGNDAKVETEKLNTQMLNQFTQATFDMQATVEDVKEICLNRGEWRLEGTNNTYVFQITKTEFIIGKSRDRVDGLISDNSAVSRIHCKFFTQGDCIYVMDMGSANGTYINGKKLNTNESQEVMAGNCIRIANMDFVLRG